jgi:hypothetical protein
MVRFVENHDEERAATVFAGARLRAAATTAYTLPGLKLLHEGQLEGLARRLPVQLTRRAGEEGEPEIMGFYRALLGAVDDPVFRLGDWHRAGTDPAWDGNGSHAQIIAHLWDAGVLGKRLAAVNLGDAQAQCRVRIDTGGLGGTQLRFRDLLGPDSYVRELGEIAERGLFLDLAPYQSHVFAVEPAL